MGQNELIVLFKCLHRGFGKTIVNLMFRIRTETIKHANRYIVASVNNFTWYILFDQYSAILHFPPNHIPELLDWIEFRQVRRERYYSMTFAIYLLFEYLRFRNISIIHYKVGVFKVSSLPIISSNSFINLTKWKVAVFLNTLA